MVEKKIFNITEASKILGMSTKTLRKYIKDGEINFINLNKGGKKIIIPHFTEKEIDDFIEGQRRKTVEMLKTKQKKTKGGIFSRRPTTINQNKQREKKVDRGNKPIT